MTEFGLNHLTLVRKKPGANLDCNCFASLIFTTSLMVNSSQLTYISTFYFKQDHSYKSLKNKFTYLCLFYFRLFLLILWILNSWTWFFYCENVLNTALNMRKKLMYDIFDISKLLDKYDYHSYQHIIKRIKIQFTGRKIISNHVTGTQQVMRINSRCILNDIFYLR